MNDAGLIVIGNEVLAGQVEEENARFLTARLRKIGVDLRRVVFLRDEVDAIAKEVREMSPAFQHVMTSGGVGSTHDDVTIRAIAEAFGRPLEEHPVLVEALRARYPSASPAVLRLAVVPKGAELLDTGMASFPLVRLENVYIFPGVPEFFRMKWLAVEHRFRTVPFFARNLYLRAEEEQIADILAAVARRFDAVDFGSYPRFDGADYRVKVSIESRDPQQVDRACAELKESLDPSWVLREETSSPGSAAP